VISKVAQACRNFGSWPLRATARQLIDCPIRTTAART
jgi:hypothetical protein